MASIGKLTLDRLSGGLLREVDCEMMVYLPRSEDCRRN